MQTLAIVIPAYKATFFGEALQSIADQACKNFTVYVGDDASPEDIKSICEEWQDAVDLRYHRFDSNLGGHDLVAQWERCVDLSHEPWVWLFSDDDIMEPDCVAAFYRQLGDDASCFDLYHFNVRVIDANGAVIREAPEFPPILSAGVYAEKRFRGQLLSYAPDYIFRRDTFAVKGGFQSFPLAWGTDDATWIKLSGEAGIRTIAGPKVCWRRSGINICAAHHHDCFDKLEASFQFLEWLVSFFRSGSLVGVNITEEKFISLCREWLFSQAKYLGVYFCKSDIIRSSIRLHRITKRYFFRELAALLRQDLRNYRALRC